MPAVLASSVVVVSADRAHRMQRSTSTEALGRGEESILTDEEEAMTAAAGIFCDVESLSIPEMFGLVDGV
ncbi:hypothetical protein HDV63DRAFT_405558 [Trichoderma sp. SZMC 28014]